MWSIPQLGFCLFNQTYLLPTFSNGPPSGVENWDGKDWHRWNRTIRDRFVFKNSNVLFQNNYVYPCSEFSWQMSLPRHPPWSYKSVIVLYVAACVMVGLFAGANLSLSIIVLGLANLRRVGFRTARNKFY